MNRREASWIAVASWTRHRFRTIGKLPAVGCSGARESAVAATLCRRNPKPAAHPMGEGDVGLSHRMRRRRNFCTFCGNSICVHRSPSAVEILRVMASWRKALWRGWRGSRLKFICGSPGVSPHLIRVYLCKSPVEVAFSCARKRRRCALPAHSKIPGSAEMALPHWERIDGSSRGLFGKASGVMSTEAN